MTEFQAIVIHPGWWYVGLTILAIFVALFYLAATINISEERQNGHKQHTKPTKP